MPDGPSLYGLQSIAVFLLLVLVSFNVSYFVIRAYIWRNNIERRVAILEDNVGALTVDWDETQSALSASGALRTGRRVPAEDGGVEE